MPDIGEYSVRSFEIEETRPELPLKRAFDCILSLFGLLLSSPLFLIYSIAVWLEDGGSVFYLQDRVGKGGRIFRAIKFRSMKPDAENGSGPLQAKEDDPRVTRVGKFLRATAMDELPQLINILRGDMSFVGPRALRPNETEVSTGNQRAVSIEEIPGYHARQMVLPGLTGVAQVFAPRDISRRKKFRYDSLYVKNQSFWFDLKLIFLSFWITFRGKWESRGRKV